MNNQPRRTPRTDRQEKLVTKGKPNKWVSSWWAEELEIESDARAHEIHELQGWKQSALQVMNQTDLQAVGRELGLTLGANVPPNILPGIQKLKERIAELEKERTDCLRALGNKSAAVSTGTLYSATATIIDLIDTYRRNDTKLREALDKLDKLKPDFTSPEVYYWAVKDIISQTFGVKEPVRAENGPPCPECDYDGPSKWSQGLWRCPECWASMENGKEKE